MFLDNIETDRLIIREFNDDDFTSVHLYASDPEVIKYLPFGPNTNLDTELFLTKVKNFQIQYPRYDYEFAVVLKENNLLIGGCGIHVTNPNNKEASIGYCYNKTYWGQGYASEAANAIIAFGFKNLNLHRVYATCAPDNIGSAKVMEKVGMTKEGHLREHKLQKGTWRDSFIYSILEHEYNSK